MGASNAWLRLGVRADFKEQRGHKVSRTDLKGANEGHEDTNSPDLNWGSLSMDS